MLARGGEVGHDVLSGWLTYLEARVGETAGIGVVLLHQATVVLCSLYFNRVYQWSAIVADWSCLPIPLPQPTRS
jgi:hypothetical protein